MRDVWKDFLDGTAVIGVKREEYDTFIKACKNNCEGLKWSSGLDLTYNRNAFNEVDSYKKNCTDLYFGVDDGTKLWYQSSNNPFEYSSPNYSVSFSNIKGELK